MNRNAIYAGCLTGVAVVVALIYPSYILLPEAYRIDRPPEYPLLGLLLALVAAGVVVGGGWLAARWGAARTGWAGIQLGALAGGIAGTMAFAALGAALAGALSLGSNPQGTAGDTIVQTAHLTYAMLWGLVLGGMALGALGGLLSPSIANVQKPRDETAIRLAEVLSMRLLLVSLLILVVTVTTLPLLLSSETIGQPQGAIALFSEAIASAFALYLTVMGWILSLARKRLATTEATLAQKRQVNGGLWFAALLSLLALSVMIIALLFGNGSQALTLQLFLSPVFLTGTVIGLGVSGYMLRLAASVSRELPAAGNPTSEVASTKVETRSFVQWENIGLLAFLGGVAFALPPLTIVPLAINLAHVMAPTDRLLIEMVQDLFRSQAVAAYGVFLIGAVTIVCSSFIAIGLSRLRPAKA